MAVVYTLGGFGIVSIMADFFTLSGLSVVSSCLTCMPWVVLEFWVLWLVVLFVSGGPGVLGVVANCLVQYL